MAAAIAMMRKAGSVAWLLPMLVGCAHYQPRPPAPAAVLDARDQRNVDPDLLARRVAALAPKAVGRSITWDRLDLFAAATLYNPEIKSARAALATAAANARAAHAATGPTLTLTSEYAHDPAASSRWLVGGLIDIPIDAGGRRRSRLEIADIATLGAQYDLAETVWTVRMAICRALTAQLIAQRQAAILTTLQAIRTRQLESAERRLAAGEIARGDVERVRNDGADVARRLNDAQEAGRTARQALAAAIGLPDSVLASIAPTWDDFDAATPDPAQMIDTQRRRTAILARADILHALGNYQSAEAELRGEVAKQYPAITLSPGYTWERGLVKIPFSLGLVLPPLDLNHRAILAAEAKRVEAGARMEAAIAGAAAAVDTAMVETRASRAALARIRDHERPVAERLAAQADLALKAGTIDRVDWAAAQAGVGLAKLAELDALARVHAADAALEDAARSPLEGPETMIEDKRDMIK